MVWGGFEVRFHDGSTRVPRGFHEGSARFCEGCGVVRVLKRAPHAVGDLTLTKVEKMVEGIHP